jgi:hypothetical protein
VYKGEGENFTGVDLMPVAEEMQGEPSAVVAEIVIVAESIHGGGASNVDTRGGRHNSAASRERSSDESAQSIRKADPKAPGWSKR